ncbi:hypothetical protein S7711_00908 [Stachybotrys chartarum IBT 7711]|uniref:Uncharacterized protein n=1 Tax=Stachybotrys chartarum (strain CBS 109288 / IBT 7711) TaxID=1280523 RepID=A0A084B0K7_STACB|nr:hypothetical protein S7711_00908 [Stachybotrys chartarum IBT 7711]KFA50203.1 hypothetical protein S40293_03708 [Stachybotrys chartarum IBT 40293]
MSSDNGSNGNRRSSFSQSTLSNIFQRGNSISGPSAQAPPPANDGQRRRLSITTLGLSGTTTSSGIPFGLRRGSVSTNSDSIDESAIDEDDGTSASTRTAPTTPFVRHMSFGASAMRGLRPGNSPGNGNNPSSPSPNSTGRRSSAQRVPQTPGSGAPAAPPVVGGRRASTALPSTSSISQASNIKHPRTPSDNVFPRADQQGFNWSEQLRTRAESSVTGARPSFSLASGSGSPPRGLATTAQHDRAKSVSDMPQPPNQAPTKPKQERPKPDAFQERILKGDFYMD